ncbi:hypothetical protein [Hyphomicrobium facile]|uniref:Tetratricopeptide repeat-containing protein n=1 Tax=Hyphomicrobium facile TaxID=51670 RepID=A0A1I7NBG4_9HYPH|nr:hypothetical protein [Hyphomicrobium facile]SFV31999.1 hypothetical protein SAMN04488557_1460 [Hyphomicrobium facile]
MGDKATLETLLSAAVFLIPIAVLFTLILLLSRRRRRSAQSPAAQPREPSAEPPQAEPLHALSPDQHAQTPPPAPVESVETILEKIETALVRGEKTALSGLYYELAAGHARLGKAEARMAALRSAAGYGALHGPPGAHAAARLALGEAAHSAGDLTTACEQWQMARTAYLQAGEAEHHARIEKRMRENGCPTDWVLTDF